MFFSLSTLIPTAYYICIIFLRLIDLVIELIAWQNSRNILWVPLYTSAIDVQVIWTMLRKKTNDKNNKLFIIKLQKKKQEIGSISKRSCLTCRYI